MLALQRHQDTPYSQHHSQPYSIPSPTPSPSQQFSFDDLSNTFSALSASQNSYAHKQKLLDAYLEAQSSAAPVTVGDDDLESQLMTSAFDFSNPAIRIQQSTPTPQLSTAYSQPSMVAASNATSSGVNWASFANNNGQLDGTFQTPVQSRMSRGHQRASSSSSIGSNGSHYQPTGHNTGFSRFSNHNQHLPTPSHTPIQEVFNMNQNFNNYTPTSATMDMGAHMSMKHALLDNGGEEEVPGFGHSARHSVSSYGHDSPATPHTSHGEDFEDRSFKMPPSDLRHTVPKFDRSFQDAGLNGLYNPNMIAQVAHSIPQNQQATNASLLSPLQYSSNSNNVVQNALKAAQNARSQSPSSSASRGVSPFRQNSPFHGVAGNNFSSPRIRVGTAAQARELQKAEADAHALKSLPLKEEPQPKTISPKDALLDYREADDDSKGSLFPDSGASEYEHQYNGSGDQYRNATQSNFDTTTPTQTFRRDNWATTPQQFSPNFSTSSGPSPSQQSFSFVPPSISGNLHSLPFPSQPYRSSQNSMMPPTSEPTPEFPIHLTSMESSCSEAGPETASAAGEQIQRPAASHADTGTYTCTYHGCTLRFETPQKLQKHKREGHRNANPTTVSSSMPSAALLERNSQAGPHKCERINPTTGKPCNTIFSRPYDLTRHEDTIHNARKQKVKCALCQEEKTFSRSDALTRHMRVVHPEVDFPGKHRRRGGNHD